jgi:hypothetical protein
MISPKWLVKLLMNYEHIRASVYYKEPSEHESANMKAPIACAQNLANFQGN